MTGVTAATPTPGEPMAARTLTLASSLTNTPLSRAFDRTLVGRTANAAIPWASFSRTAYPQAALDLAAGAQRKLAIGEYSAVPLFARIVSALAECGAPFDLISAAARVPTDEIRHAEQATRMMQLMAPDAAAPLALDIAPLEARWSSRSTWRALDAVVVESAVIGESLACALLDACLARAEDVTVRAHFAALVADEIHHARFGWYYLAYRSESWTRPERQRVADCAAKMLVNLESWFAIGRDAPRSCRAAARALGVLDTAGQRRAIKRVVEDEIVPGLDALGLGASQAWRVRRRVD